MPGAHRLSSSPFSEASPGVSNGRLNRTGSVDSLDDRSSTSSGGGCGGSKQISSENVEFIPTRSTKLTAPKPAYNPMQFVRVGPAKLHKTAREQIAQAETVKKMQASIKEEEEDWQSNLDNWKFSRRKRQEHVIVKLQEVKKLEEETHDRSKKRNKTFNEILQHRTRHGRSLSIPTYSNDEGEEWGDDDGQTKSEPESGIGSEGDAKDRKFMEDADGDDESTNKQNHCYYANGEVEYTYEKAIEDYRQYAESHSSKIKMLKVDTRVDSYSETHSPLNGKLSGDSGTCSETSDGLDESEFHRKRVEEISQQIDICRSTSYDNVRSPRRKSLEVSKVLKEKISSMQKQQDTGRIENKTAYPQRDHNFHRKLEGFQSGRKEDDIIPNKTTPERDVGFRDKLKSFSRIENGLKIESPNDKVVPERSQNFRDKLSSFESLKCVEPSAKSFDVRDKRGFERTQSLSRLTDAGQTSSAPTSPSPYMYKVNSTPFLEIDLISEASKNPDEDIMTKSETRKILPSVSFDSLSKLDASGVRLRPRPVNPLPKPSLKHRRTVIEVVERTEEEYSHSDEDEDQSEEDERVQNQSNCILPPQHDQMVSRIDAIPSFTRVETHTNVEKSEELRFPKNDNIVTTCPSQNTIPCDNPSESSLVIREIPQRDGFKTLVYSSSNHPRTTVNDGVKKASHCEEAATTLKSNLGTKLSPPASPIMPKTKPGLSMSESPLFHSSDSKHAPPPPLRKIDNSHIGETRSKWDANPSLLSPTLTELPKKVLMDIRLDETSKNLILGESISQVPILEVEFQGPTKEPPKEKPPPPPPDSDSDLLDETEGDPKLKRMGSTQRLKKDLRRRRSNFLGLDEEEEPKLEEILPPPPDVKSLMHEEIKFQKERERELLSLRSEEQCGVSTLSLQESPSGLVASPTEQSMGRTWESVKLEASLYDGQLSPEDEEILREERKIIEALEKEEQLQLQRRTEYENYRIARLEAERRNMVADKSRREEEQLQQREMDPVTSVPITDPNLIRKESIHPNITPSTIPNQSSLSVSKPIPPDGFYGPVTAQTSPPRPVRNAPPAPPVKPRRTLPRSPQEIIYTNGPINGTHGARLVESESKTCDMKYAARKKIDPIPKKSDYKKHWLIQEAEQRRIMELQEREQHKKGFKSLQSPVSYQAGYHPNEKALPENVIQTLTQRVQTKMNQQSYPYETCSPVYENIPGNYLDTKETNAAIIHPLYDTYMNGVPESPLLSVSGRKRCSHCSQELGRGAAMIIESLHLFYHIHCFKCCVCNTQLGNGTMGADVRVRNNKLHCQNCYSNEDGVKFSRV